MPKFPEFILGLVCMNVLRTNRSFFAGPHAAVFLLLTANILFFGLCLAQTGMVAIPTDDLLRNGAMYSFALGRHEYWRLIAYGFLHANHFHLTLNMICLAIWGGHLERRVGAFYFIVIYVCALVAGAVVSNATHAGPYLTVGASAAISGVLGALLSLRILGRVDLPASFFVVNIGLNVALALGNSSIDWAAHIGGFAARMMVCALLDLLEKVNARLLRCKFPEFVKINAFVVVAGVALLFWNTGSGGGHIGKFLAGAGLCQRLLRRSQIARPRAVDEERPRHRRAVVLRCQCGAVDSRGVQNHCYSGSRVHSKKIRSGGMGGSLCMTIYGAKRQ